MPKFLLARISWLVLYGVIIGQVSSDSLAATPLTAKSCCLLKSVSKAAANTLQETDSDHKWNAAGDYQTAWIVDPGLAALRRQPELAARCLRRLRLGRKVYVINSKYSRTAQLRYYYIAVTRRTRGYIDPGAVVIAGKLTDEQRLLRLIENAKDTDKVTLAQIVTQAFPRSKILPDVWLAEGFAAESIALRLSAQARRRRALAILDPTLDAKRYWQNWAVLDRYNRLGLHWSFDAANLTFIYDGQAFQRILRRFPHSAAAKLAQQKLLTTTAPLPPVTFHSRQANSLGTLPLNNLPLITPPTIFPLEEHFDPEDDL